MQMEEAVAKALEAEIISLPIMAGEMEKVIREQEGRLAEIAREIHEGGFEHLVFLGSGASMTVAYSGKYLMDKFSRMRSELFIGPELLERRPPWLGEKTFAVVVSYSGKTEDTLNALRFVKGRGARALALTKSPDTPIATEADEALTYGSKALYICPLTQIHLLCLHLLKLRGELPEADLLLDELRRLPDIVKRVVDESEERSKELAERYWAEPMFYVMGGGPLYGLAYQFALTTIMEYLRLDACVIHLGEFRHGPIEVVRQGHPPIIILLGADETRKVGERVVNFCRKYGAKTIVFDVKDYAEAHPLFSPFLLFPPLQWLLLHISVKRGIDLDEYLYMGVVPF